VNLDDRFPPRISNAELEIADDSERGSVCRARKSEATATFGRVNIYTLSVSLTLRLAEIFSR